MPLARPEVIAIASNDSSDRRVLTSLDDFTRLDGGPSWIQGDKRQIELHLVNVSGGALDYLDVPDNYIVTLNARREDAFEDGDELFTLTLTEGKNSKGNKILEGPLDLTAASLATALETPDVQVADGDGIRLRCQLHIKANDNSEVVRLFFPALLRANIDPAA